MVYLGFKCQKQNVLLYFIKRKILEFKLWVKIINFLQCKRKLFFKDKNLGTKKIYGWNSVTFLSKKVQ